MNSNIPRKAFFKEIESGFIFESSLKNNCATIDLSTNNLELNKVKTVKYLAEYVKTKITEHNKKYGIGGYLEKRKIYEISNVFTSNEGFRNNHLGIDIWAPQNTKVFSIIDGTVHSYKFNKVSGDYGATLILKHNIGENTFFTLYGHLSLKSIQNKILNQPIKKGECIADLGDFSENGNWPPHLHFQLILGIEGYHGDYPGVCNDGDLDFHKNNCPNPMFVLK